jgi:membrane protease YdiL (CAAX protease family)
MGVNYPKEKGFFIYQLLSILVSLEAAVSEECVYRGIIQTTWQSAFGKKKGLILSAILFGLLHVTRPQEPLYWYYGLMASLGGIYFGWLYEKDNYCLSRPIAGHFWFNALAFATTFLVKPTLNPLGVKVRF